MAGPLGVECLLVENLLSQILASDLKIRRDIAKNRCQRADFELFLRRNSDVVVRTFDIRSQSKMTSCLASDLITETPKQAREFFPTEVAGKSQAEMTSSLTMCRRITRGRESSGKWQATASRTIDLSSSKESA